MQNEDLTGDIFHGHRVIAVAKRSPGRNTTYYCVCLSCGRLSTRRNTDIKRRGCVSCAHIKHGHCANGHNSKEHSIWSHMKARCYNPRKQFYANYGGRGITVCDRWRNSFEAFLADMGPRPSPAHSLDRIDNDGDYCPENCRWATHKEQARNTRRNNVLMFRGRSQCLTAWAAEIGISPLTLSARINKGWTTEDALCRPVAAAGGRRCKSTS